MYYCVISLESTSCLSSDCDTEVPFTKHFITLLYFKENFVLWVYSTSNSGEHELHCNQKKGLQKANVIVFSLVVFKCVVLYVLAGIHATGINAVNISILFQSNYYLYFSMMLCLYILCGKLICNRSLLLKCGIDYNS